MPYVKMPMNIRMIPALAKITAVVCSSVGGSSAVIVGGSSRAASDPARRPMTAALVIAWIRSSGSSSTISLPGPDRSAGTISAASIDLSRSASSAAAWSGTVLISRVTSYWSAIASIDASRPAGGVSTSARFGDFSWPSSMLGSTKPATSRITVNSSESR